MQWWVIHHHSSTHQQVCNSKLFFSPFLPYKNPSSPSPFSPHRTSINHMEKIPFFLILLSLAMAAANEADEWLSNRRQATEKTTRLHFYHHETTSGKNPTAVQVAQAASTNKSPTLFGLVNIMDDPLTEGPELTSKLVGRGQGLYASAGMDELSLLMAWTVVFNSGEYSGSSLTILGRNPTSHPRREMSIVGGTGIFRLARGVLTFRTYFFNSSAGVAVLEVDAVVIHF